MEKWGVRLKFKIKFYGTSEQSVKSKKIHFGKNGYFKYTKKSSELK